VAVSLCSDRASMVTAAMPAATDSVISQVVAYQAGL
jgi:hypothetical protein